MMKSGIEHAKVLLLCLLVTPFTATADVYELTAADWSRPRSAAMVTGLEPVAAAVREWHAVNDARPGAILVLRHSAGEESALWASELRDWLVALGIPEDSIRRELGGVDDSELELEVRSR